MGPMLLTTSKRFLFADGPVSHILSLQLTASSISTMVSEIKAPFQWLILLSSLSNSECIFISRNPLKLPNLNCSLINLYSFCNHTNACMHICFVPCYVKWELLLAINNRLKEPTFVSIRITDVDKVIWQTAAFESAVQWEFTVFQ